MQLTERQQSQAAEVERGVADAIKGRDFEVAANLAAGHPDVRRHGELMKDIFNAKHPNGAVSAIEVTRTDLAGTPILPRSTSARRRSWTSTRARRRPATARGRRAT